jgi:uncharacterized protein (TIGR00266 family)
VQYRILYRPSFALAQVQLAEGEALRTESGAMVGMTPNLNLEAKMEGGLLKSLGRAMLAGESFFQSTYTAHSGSGEILLAPSTPGDIMAVELQAQSYMVQQGSYLASAAALALETRFAGMAQMFASEGAFMVKVSGTGLLLLSSYGAIHKISLAAGEQYIVDSGHIVAFDENVSYQVTKAAKGFMASVTSGEGLVVRYTGPGDIYLQTRNLKAFVDEITPFLPKPTPGR